MKKKFLFLSLRSHFRPCRKRKCPIGFFKKENENWFTKQEWLGGLKLQTHSSVDVLQQNDPAKDFDVSKWESQKKYTGLQYVISEKKK